MVDRGTKLEGTAEAARKGGKATEEKGGRHNSENENKESAIKMHMISVISEVIASSERQSFPHAVPSLPSSCMYPCQRCSTSGASEEQLYRAKVYLTPAWKLADDKERDYYVLYGVVSHLTAPCWQILEIKVIFEYVGRCKTCLLFKLLSNAHGQE